MFLCLPFFFFVVIAEEEARFERTLHRGTIRFNRIAEKAKKSGVVSGADIWDLWSTFGFPVDLTELMADEKGLKLDKVLLLLRDNGCVLIFLLVENRRDWRRFAMLLPARPRSKPR